MSEKYSNIPDRLRFLCKFDQILTDARGHGSWRYVSEADSRIIIEGFD